MLRLMAMVEVGRYRMREALRRDEGAISIEWIVLAVAAVGIAVAAGFAISAAVQRRAAGL